jgi:hypothetical protein
MSAPSFENDILPLFRPMDIQCMRGLEPDRGGPVLLADYTYMSAREDGVYAHAQLILDYLKGTDAQGDEVSPRMPFGGPYWTDENIALFADWIAGGCQP